MKRGGLGLLSERGWLALPLDFLEHLAVTDGGVLYGCYYPRVKSPELNPESSIEHDFLFTPVPSRFWDRCARFMLRVRQRPGTLNKVAKVFGDNGAAVLHSECTRSGHRYATWSLHVTFEDVDHGTFDADKSWYTGTDQARRKLADALEACLGEELFVDAADPDLRVPVRSWTHTSLAYFHDYVMKAERQGGIEAWRYTPFRVHCTADGILRPDDSKRLYNIISSLPSSPTHPIAPAVVFSSIDSHSFTVRVALVPNDLLPSFFKINVVHERAGHPDTCRGLIADILDALGPSYSCWRVYNYIERHSQSGSEGHIVILAEDLTRGAHEDAMACIGRAKDRLRDGAKIGMGGHNRIAHVSFSPITIRTVESRLDDQMHVYNVPRYATFISFQNEDRGFANELRTDLEKEGLRAFVAEADLRTGTEISPKIREAILSSQEICVLCTQASGKSMWVATELGAAWALGKLIVPISIQVDWKDMPIRLSVVEGVRWEDRGKYIRELRQRRTERGWGNTASRGH